MAINRKWVLYNTLTGAIIKELPASDDSVYLDINSGDEATLTIPAYSLTSTDRTTWTSVFKSWARGIALIDNNKAYNASGAVIFAGPIIKRNFNGNDETITLTAYGIYEYLKKITVPPVWTEITDATATETFTADSWAGVYSAVLQRGIDPTGKPAGLNFMSTFTGLPTVTGTGYSYTVKVTDQVKVSDVFEDIRDNVSTHGNEFRFVPTFTDATMTVLTWNLLVGTDAAPKLNYSDLSVPLYEEATPTKIWRATEYTVDDDSTLIYNKLVINGSTDPVTANMETVYDATTDPEMPILTEVFEPGVTITQAQLDTQKAQRIIGSLIGDKNITLALSNDLNFDSFGYIGNKITLDVSGSDKMAGTGTKARAVGIRFTSKSRENEVTIELMKIQARYPKLPKDQTTDMLTGDGGYDFGDISYSGGLDFGNPTGDYGTGSGGFDTGGETYVPPPVEPGTPEVTNPNMITSIANTFTGTADLQTGLTISNLSPEGYYYASYLKSSYMNDTDLMGDIIIKCRKVTLNETASQEVKADTQFVSSYTIPAASINSIMNTLPATISYYSSINPLTTATIGPTNQYPIESRGRVILHSWVIKNKLYILITKGRIYANNIFTGGIRYEQKLFTLDINTSTGALSNLQTINGKWGTTSITSNPNIFLTPDSGDTYYSGTNGEYFKINDNNILFMKIKKWYNFTNVGGGYLDLTKWSSTEVGYRATPIKPIRADFTASGAPLYYDTGIVPPTPVPDTAINSTVYSSGTSLTTNYKDTVGEYHSIGSYIYTYNDAKGNYNFAKYIYNPTQNKIYCVMWNNFNQTVYTTDIAILKTQTRYKVFVCDLGAGSTSFSQLGGSIESLLSATLKTELENSYALAVLPLNDNVYISIGNDGVATTPAPAKQLVLKNGQWVEQRRSTLSSSTTLDSLKVNQSITQTFAYLKNSAGKDVIIYVPGAGYIYPYYNTIQEELSPYKVKCKYVTKYFALDTTNKLWTFSAGSSDTNLWGSTQPKWSETTVPMKHPNNTSWKQIVTNYSYQSVNHLVLAIASDNTLWAWGSNQNYLTGQAINTGVTATPTQIGTKTWSKVVVGTTVAAALDTDGALYTWGSGSTSGLGQGTTGTVVNPTRVGTGTYIDLDIASTGLMVIDSNRDLYFTGAVTGQTTRNTLGILGSQKWKKVVTSDSHYMGITTSDTLFALGSNAQGRTGLNTITGTATTWTQVGTDTWLDIAVTKNGATTNGASFGIKTGGTLWEWGYNGLNGITGTGNTLVPSQAGTDTDWTAVFPDGYCVRSNGVAYSPTGLGSETWAGTIAYDWRTIFGGETG